MKKLQRTLLLGCLLAGLGLTMPAMGQVRKKSEEPIKDRKLLSLLRDLKHKEARNRVAALQDLLQRAEVRLADAKPAIPYVVPLLKDRDAGVRRTAILVLDTLEADPRLFVPPLVDLLKKEKDTGVRYAAVVAVRHLGPPARSALPALEAMQKALKNNPKEKMLAAEVNAAIQRLKKK